MCNCSYVSRGHTIGRPTQIRAEAVLFPQYISVNSAFQRWEADMDVEKVQHHRRRSGRLGQDKLEHVAVGDPDPTSNSGASIGYRRCCSTWTNEIANLILHWSCTRERGHQGGLSETQLEEVK
jgi:hypothetical protein